MVSMGKYITILWLGLSGSLAMAGEGSLNDCGSTLSQVKQIILSKVAGADPATAERLKGQWLSSYGQFDIRTMNTPFKIASWDVLACPKANGTFVLIWKDDGKKAGILSMRGSNRLVIAQTKMGTIQLEREGSMTASRD